MNINFLFLFVLLALQFSPISSQTWRYQTQGTGGQARHLPSTILGCNGDLWTFGGGFYIGNYLTYYDAAERFNLSSRTWTTIKSESQLPAFFPIQMAASFDPTTNKIYVFGGRFAGIGSTDNFFYHYDCVTQNWVNMTSTTPNMRSSHIFVYAPSIQRHVLMGGMDENRGIRSDVWFWNAGTSTWNQVVPSPAGVSRMVATGTFVSSRNSIVFSGGYSSSSLSAPDLSDIVEFDLNTRDTNVLGNYAQPIEGHVLVYVQATSLLVTIGGWFQNDSMNNQVLVMFMDATTVGPLTTNFVQSGPFIRYGARGFLVGSTIYVHAGFIDSAFNTETNDVLSFTMLGSVTTALSVTSAQQATTQQITTGSASQTGSQTGSAVNGGGNNTKNNSNDTGTIIGIVIGLVVIPAIILVIVIILIFVLRRRRDSRGLSQQAELQSPRSPKKSHWKVLTDIVVGDRVGGGNFGDVYKGQWMGTTNVALKKLKDADHVQEFEKEAQVLQAIVHPNVVQYLGMYFSPEGEQYLVMEWLSLGSLDHFLRNASEPLPNDKLILMAKQAAAGMQYLHDKKIIHRDLALRNLLITVSSEGYLVKISDFGMSRELEKEYYKSDSKTVPVKWSPPEVIDSGHFSTKSDVWSFGVVLWELYSSGKIPYPGMSNKEAYEAVCRGYRMPTPTGCPEPIYKIMLDCWNSVASQRPTIKEIFYKLEELATVDGQIPQSRIEQDTNYSTFGSGESLKKLPDRSMRVSGNYSIENEEGGYAALGTEYSTTK